MKEVLQRLLATSECDFVLTSPNDPSKPLGAWVLETQIGDLRKKIKTHPDAGLHGLRHTFLTEAGEYADPFTLQYVAGHDSIKTTMRYVHPQADAVQRLFVRLAAIDRNEIRLRKRKVRKVGAKSGAGATVPQALSG